MLLNAHDKIRIWTIDNWQEKKKMEKKTISLRQHKRAI